MQAKKKLAGGGGGGGGGFLRPQCPSARRTITMFYCHYTHTVHVGNTTWCRKQQQQYILVITAGNEKLLTSYIIAQPKMQL